VLAYCVSKAGVDQLTRCAVLEMAPLGVRINAVNPGVTITNLQFLASDRASWMTGETIPIDGGRHLTCTR
jgi:NAD(P)-dependent dehydrogenase (short-subunit alcohol dehydrogenase family)